MCFSHKSIVIWEKRIKFAVDKNDNRFLQFEKIANMSRKIVILVATAFLLWSCNNKETQTREEAVSVRTQKVEAGAQRAQLLDTWVEKSEIEKKIARASMQPVVLLGGTANYSKLLAEWHSKAIAFATVQIPISAFWSERRMYNWKKVEVEKAKDFRQDKRELISLQIQDAWDNLESTYRQTQIAKKSVERSEENLRINREHYLNGMTNMTELLDAQRQWQQALTSRNAANSEYLQAKTRYLILTGRREEVKP